MSGIQALLAVTQMKANAANADALAGAEKQRGLPQSLAQPQLAFATVRP